MDFGLSSEKVNLDLNKRYRHMSAIHIEVREFEIIAFTENSPLHLACSC